MVIVGDEGRARVPPARRCPCRQPRKPPPRIRIENVKPVVDCGRHPAKRSVGDTVDVQATVFRDGHEILGARVLYRGPGAKRWESAPLEPLGNDLFIGSFEVTGRPLAVRSRGLDRPLGDLARRAAAQVRGGRGRDLASELAEGEALLGLEEPRRRDGARLDDAADTARRASARRRSSSTSTAPLGRFGAWYELFPRSFGGFKGVEKVLPQLAELGFDVVYFPPIHPIGAHGPQGRATTRCPRSRATPAARGRSAPRRAATTRSIPSSARSPTSTASSRARTSSASRSRSTSRSSARPTTRG